MSTKSFERGFTWSGLVLAALAAGAVLAVVPVAPASAGEGGEKQTKIKLVVARDGVAERITLVDLHEMSVGESRTVASENGRTVVVTRDADGFEVDVDGRKIRLQDHFSEGETGETRVFQRRIVIDDDEDSGPGMTMFHSGDGEPGEVMVMKRVGPEGHSFAWATDGAELPAIPFGVEGTISRLEKNARFQELDAATRAKVLAALRETAPQRLLLDGPALAGDSKARVMVIEVDGDDGEN